MQVALRAAAPIIEQAAPPEIPVELRALRGASTNSVSQPPDDTHRV
jgi:hypothetical protein